MRQIVERQKSLPLVLAAAAVDRKHARPRTTRSERCRLLADVTGAIGIDDVLAGNFPSLQCVAELCPVLRAIERQCTHVTGGSGFGANPAQRNSAIALFPHDGSVSRELDRGVDGVAALHLD